MNVSIVRQLRIHAPFTLCGAASGILIMVLFQNIPYRSSFSLFYILHPLHVLLSALVTASMYKLHARSRQKSRVVRFLTLLCIGYAGSVGIATISDSVIPYLGEAVLRMPNRGIHLGFIERWWLVNPLAVAGVVIASLCPTTKFPHAGHVLLSTWASLFHIMMAAARPVSWALYPAIFIFLFLAVWLPCCLSDIVFPLLLVRGGRGESKAS